MKVKELMEELGNLAKMDAAVLEQDIYLNAPDVGLLEVKCTSIGGLRPFLVIHGKQDNRR